MPAQNSIRTDGAKGRADSMGRILTLHCSSGTMRGDGGFPIFTRPSRNAIVNLMNSHVVIERQRRGREPFGCGHARKRLHSSLTQPGRHWYLHKLCSTESHRREPVNCSIPTCVSNDGTGEAGLERSTGSRRGDSREFSVSGRSGLNDPPAPAGGIRKA